MGMHCLYHFITVLTVECTNGSLRCSGLNLLWKNCQPLTGATCTCSQCSLIAEWEMHVKGRPDRHEIPLCSVILKQRVRKVDPL